MWRTDLLKIEYIMAGMTGSIMRKIQSEQKTMEASILQA